MPIFQLAEGIFKKLTVDTLGREKKLQVLVEQNLWEVFEMHLLATEYPTTSGGRIDTLAIDSNGAPVIIEYKLNQNDNVINQALSYLRWLKAQKVEFLEMLMIKKLGKDLAASIKIDWHNPRVICVAESYNRFDIDTVEVVPIRIELYKYRFYDSGIFNLESLNVAEQTFEKQKSSKPKTPDSKASELSQIYGIGKEDLFEELRNRIFQIDKEITEKITPKYSAFRVSKNFAEVHVRKTSIVVNLRHLHYDDPLHLIRKVPDSHNWTLDHILTITNVEELNYGMQFIEQSYKDVL